MNQAQIDLAKYRLHDAEEKLKAAEILSREQHLKDSLSRSYYAMFSAIRSLLALKDVDSSKHSGVISLFYQHFVKTGTIDVSFGRLLKKGQLSRERSDYGDYIIVTKDEVTIQLINAEQLIAEAK